MEEENKSLQSSQYLPTMDAGYKISVGANGQGTLFDTNGNMFHFTSPDNDYLKQLTEVKWDRNVNLTADNRTMIAAGSDLFNTPFFKLNILGCINYETSNESITNDVLPAVEPADEEVTYSKDGNTWTFKFEEKNRGITGFNLRFQSDNNFIAIHQLSNVATKIVGDDLKSSYSKGEYYKVDLTNIKLEYKSDKPITYKITIPLKPERLPQYSHTCIEHKGSWSDVTRTYDIAKHEAYKAIYGTTPFDYPPGLPRTWNFPKTNVDSTDASGWYYFNIIKQSFPLYSFIQKTDGVTSNNIFEVFFAWNDVDSVKLINTTTPKQQPTTDDELGEDGFEFVEDVIGANPTTSAGVIKMAKTDEYVISEEEQKAIDFNIQSYAALTTQNGGEYNTIADAIIASTAKTPDGQLFLKWWTHVLQWEGAGGIAQGGDSGGLTTWGLTYQSWHDNAAKVFPGKYTGTADELKSLNTEAGKSVIGAVAKAAYWDIVCKGSDTTTPDIFKCIAFENMWGGQNLMGKGNIWKNAQKMNKELGGDIQAAFVVLWGWKRACRNDKEGGNLFNLPTFPGDRWGLGWSSRTGIGWFTKDPSTGAALPTASPYKFTTDSRKSTYQFYLETLKGTAFHKGDANWKKLPGKPKKGRPTYLDILTDFTLGKVTYQSKSMAKAVTYNGPNEAHY